MRRCPRRDSGSAGSRARLPEACVAAAPTARLEEVDDRSTARIPVSLAHRLLRAARGLGIDEERICRAAGFDREDRRAGLLGGIALGELFGLWEMIIALAADPGLPIRVAEDDATADYGIVVMGALTRPDLGEALRFFARAFCLWTRSAAWRLHPSGDVLELELLQGGAPRLGLCCTHELLLADAASVIRTGLGAPAWAPLRVDFRHAPPSDIARHEAFFAAPVAFARPRTQLVIDAADLPRPMLRADPLLAGYFDAQAARAIAEAGAHPGDLVVIEAAIQRALGAGDPRVETVSRDLGLSTRTLRRRLEGHALSFKALVDRIRCDRAMRLLADPELTIGEIAYQLGFAAPSPFYRAFRRWTGASPERFRARRGPVDGAAAAAEG